MIPSNINRGHVLSALKEINNVNIPQERNSIKYDLVYGDKVYPPKYVLSIANKYANGEELETTLFSGGDESNSYLQKLGFQITSKDIQYPIQSFSWTIISENIAFKEMDKSSFIHRGTVIPQDIRMYFNAELINKGENRKISLIYEDKVYDARIEYGLSERTRMFWNPEFAGLIKNILPDWYDLFTENNETEKEKPKLTFERDSVKKDTYKVKFVVLQNPAATDISLIQCMYEAEEKHAKRLDNKALAKRAKESPSTNINARKTLTTSFQRNAYVSEYAKRRAKGVCQLCEKEAPFNNKDREPYLETHHIDWLSSGGTDTIENTVALCPNCHRKMHILDLEKERCKLKKMAVAKYQDLVK